MAARRDIQSEITTKIIELIEEHGTGWTKPFSDLGGSPTNALTGKKYRGLNAFWLGLLGKTHVATFKQWQELGAQVKKGSKGTGISVPMIIKDKETDAVKGTWFKAATVFSSDQVEGWEPPAQPDQVDLTEVLASVDAFVDATGADVRFSSNGGCYFRPSEDYIHMLPREQFTGTDTSTATECFYSTELHELVHWSGHKSRLDRLDLKNRNGYPFEELVAEIGSAILCTDLGVSTEPRADHAQYIASWLQALKGDKQFIFKAAAQAQKAVDFLHGLQGAQQEVAA